MFALHPQLAADTFEIGDFPLSKVLLMNNAHLTWVILVPKRANIREWHELSKQDQLQLHAESIALGEALMDEFDGTKLNTGALGNIVPQMHLHHIVRFESDPAWPAPVWGNIANTPYQIDAAKEQIERIKNRLSTLLK